MSVWVNKYMTNPDENSSSRSLGTRDRYLVGLVSWFDSFTHPLVSQTTSTFSVTPLTQFHSKTFRNSRLDFSF